MGSAYAVPMARNNNLRGFARGIARAVKLSIGRIRSHVSLMSFPREEAYGLTSQLRRAAVSIPANIAEGYCRRRTRVYANHVSIALGSHGEVETLVEIAHRLGYLNDANRVIVDQQLASVGRLLHALFEALERKLGPAENPVP